MKRHSISLAIVLVLSIAGSLQVHAQSQFGIGLMYDIKGKESGVDTRIVLPIVGKDWRFEGNLDLFFPTDALLVRFDGNLQYVVAPFRRGGGAYLYAGLDIGYFSRSHSSTSNTELGINIGGGISGPVGPFSLFGDLKLILGNYDGILLGGGLLFDL